MFSRGQVFVYQTQCLNMDHLDESGILLYKCSFSFIMKGFVLGEACYIDGCVLLHPNDYHEDPANFG